MIFFVPVGWIIAGTGSYDAPFMVVGGLMAAGGLLYFTILCFRERYGYKPPSADEEETLLQPQRRRRKHRQSRISESFS